MVDIDAAQRSAVLVERARKAVNNRRYTDRPGAAWRLNEIDTPVYCGTYAKAYIYTSDDGSIYEVITFAYSDGHEIARRPLKGLDAAFRNGQQMADQPDGTRAD